MQLDLEELPEKIRILEAENQRLSERAEETLLLSLVAENLNHANNRMEVLENVLEKISILKSIPYCACYSIHEHSLKLLCTYAIFSDDTSPRIQITLPSEIFKELDQGPYIVDVDSEEAKGIAINSQGMEFTPKTVAIFPFESRSISRGIFAFIDDDPTGDRLSPMSMLLQQIADMTCARLDNLSLLKELKQINTELDRRVEERTKELNRTNKRLQTEIKERRRSEEALKESENKFRQAQKMESVGTLAGGIAHDFNNILSAIIGYAELTLTDTAENSGVRNNLEEIFKAGQRAKDLVRQILAFSRQNEQELKPVQINLIVREALKLLRASLPSTIEIRQNIQPQVENVMADSTQIHQVLMNLCTNSAHAMQESGGVLEINLSSEELDSDFTIHHPGIYPGRYLKLTVADSGCGIPPEFLERIFDPYFTTKDKGQGTGLGLAVVHGIAKSHGGTITVESEPAKGSIFNLFLPTIEREAESSVDIQKASPTGNERILFVDDEKVLADIGKLMMESLGYEVETRTSSIEALELFRAKPDYFHLVITDMTMPHMTGDKLAKEILRIRPNIPIIISTGFSEKISEKKAKALGIKAFVMKPVIMDKLAVIIRKVIDES